MPFGMQNSSDFCLIYLCSSFISTLFVFSLFLFLLLYKASNSSLINSFLCFFLYSLVCLLVWFLFFLICLITFYFFWLKFDYFFMDNDDFRIFLSLFLLWFNLIITCLLFLVAYLYWLIDWLINFFCLILPLFFSFSKSR